MKDWLEQYIDNAFIGVTLKSDVDIYAAQSMDSYGDPVENELSRRAEQQDWRKVPLEDLQSRAWSSSYFDAHAYHFYAPVYMKAILHFEDNSMLWSGFLLWLREAADNGTIDGIPYCHLFNRAQRAAVVRFLKYSLYSSKTYCPEEAREILTKLRIIRERPS